MPNGLGLIYAKVNGSVPPRQCEQLSTIGGCLVYGLIDLDLIGLQCLHCSQSPSCGKMYRWLFGLGR